VVNHFNIPTRRRENKKRSQERGLARVKRPISPNLQGLQSMAFSLKSGPEPEAMETQNHV
jgi:hypothetical protein